MGRVVEQGKGCARQTWCLELAWRSKMRESGEKECHTLRSSPLASPPQQPEDADEHQQRKSSYHATNDGPDVTAFGSGSFRCVRIRCHVRISG